MNFFTFVSDVWWKKAKSYVVKCKLDSSLKMICGTNSYSLITDDSFWMSNDMTFRITKLCCLLQCSDVVIILVH